MGSYVANPLSGLIEGLLQGHQLGQQLHRQQQEDIAFKTNQALHEQQMSIQDIMNRQMLQEQARPVSQAGTIDNPAVKGPASPVPGLPDEAGVPAYSRPADAARTVNYGGGQYELKTPEEIQQTRLRNATDQKHATMTPIQTPDHLRKLGMPDQIWVPDEHLAQYAESTGQSAPVATPPVARQMGYPEQVPFRNLPAVMTGVNQTLNRQANVERTDKTLKSREQVAADNRDAANTRADNRNSTTLDAAGIRSNRTAATATPGQQGVANRFEQRRQDQAQKNIQAIQAKEDELHAARMTIGEELKDPSLPETKRQEKMRQLKTSAFQIQSYQTRKATLAGATTPGKDIQDKIPEGQQATGPDGHTWLKKGGIVYFVQ